MLVATAMAAVIVLPLLAAPEWFLGLFGEGFASGATALRWLAAAQFFNVATGPVGAMLLMSGNERAQAKNESLGALVNILLAALLIPEHGMTGAAVASATAIVFKNVVAVLLVSRNLSIQLWKPAGDD